MTLLLIHAGATLAMAGLIWFVQIVHYPLFDLASERRFGRFAAEHQRRTSFVVVPLMLIEAGSALAILAAPPLGLGRGLPWLGLLLLALIWLSTALLAATGNGSSRYAACVSHSTTWIASPRPSGRRCANVPRRCARNGG